MKDNLARLRNGETLSGKDQLTLIFQLSLPAILAQISTIILSYVDASMVGRLGADSAAAIGLVSSTTWLIGGLTSAVASGFTVQVAHRVGARRYPEARGLVRHGLWICLCFALLVMGIGLWIAPRLPGWLGGDPSIHRMASSYFRIYILGLPIMQLNHASGGMLQCSGNMKVPGVLNICMCFLNVIFNALLIFPRGTFRIPGLGLSLPGAGLGVAGAALGTVLAQAVILSLMLYFLLVRSTLLHLRRGEKMPLQVEELRSAARISIPQGFESAITGSAYVAFTAIVAPLGNVAIAANSFSITAESLCYMPAFGVAAAATTLIGQSFGAGRRELTKHLSWLLTFLTMGVMCCTGTLLYLLAPWMIGLLSPDEAVRVLGTRILRIEAFAEPLYGASIAINGVFRGMGDTLTSSVLNLVSMWAVRIPLAARLSLTRGLPGVWTAMCIELCVRGSLFIGRLIRKKV